VVLLEERLRLSSSGLVWLGGSAAFIGGAMWAVKAMSILLTGVQPPLVFEVALPLFALGLLGPVARLGGRRGPLGTAGLVVACVAVLSGVIAFATGLNLFVAVAGFGPFLGLVLVGGAVLQAREFPQPWSALPLALGLGGTILIFVGGGLALIDERLLEVPILTIGLAWMLLGYSVLVIRAG
jgi:hypothetical protein